jgi:uncharacterized protein (DUF697 family)
MNKKKLPKAIRITGDNAGKSEAVLAPVESLTAPPTPDEPLDKSGTAADPAPAEGLVRPASHEPLQIPALEEAVAAGPLESPMPQVGANSTHALVRVSGDEVRRRWQARAIVERHANYSAVGGFIPLPIVNIAGITAIILRMVKSLSNLYGVPFERNRARTIITGLIGGLTPATLSTLTASSLLFIVPGSNLLGLAVSSVTASACTRRIGWIFIDHFESGATLFEFPLPAMR